MLSLTFLRSLLLPHFCITRGLSIRSRDDRGQRQITRLLLTLFLPTSFLTQRLTPHLHHSLTAPFPLSDPLRQLSIDPLHVSPLWAKILTLDRACCYELCERMAGLRLPPAAFLQSLARVMREEEPREPLTARTCVLEPCLTVPLPLFKKSLACPTSRSLPTRQKRQAAGTTIARTLSKQPRWDLRTLSQVALLL
jgi:hypothetical protein